MAVVTCCAPVFAVTAAATMAVYMLVGLIVVPVEFIVCGTSLRARRFRSLARRNAMHQAPCRRTAGHGKGAVKRRGSFFIIYCKRARTNDHPNTYFLHRAHGVYKRRIYALRAMTGMDVEMDVRARKDKLPGVVLRVAFAQNSSCCATMSRRVNPRGLSRNVVCALLNIHDDNARNHHGVNRAREFL